MAVILAGLGFAQAINSAKTMPLTDASAWGEYRRFYGLDLPANRHHAAWLDSGDHRLLVQRFEPVQPARGTVQLVHGFLDHAGVQRHLIARLLEAGYAVRTVDLPGHGLSSGRVADIDSMDEYQAALTAFLDGQPRPLNLVCHSMGCAVSAEAMRRGLIGPKDRVVFQAPLLRWSKWGLSGVASALVGWAMDSVPRAVVDTSGCPDFQRMRQNDPLRPPRMGTAWVRAMRSWSYQFDRGAPLKHAPVILQGESDGVVAWRYNLKRYRRHFPGAVVARMPGARHHLQGESPKLLQEHLRRVMAALNGERP